MFISKKCLIAILENLSILNHKVEKLTEDKTKRGSVKRRWIPVEDRLPDKKYEKVLICEEYGRIYTGKYDRYSGRWYKGDMCAVGGHDVIAWMPLPEPYCSD